MVPKAASLVDPLATFAKAAPLVLADDLVEALGRAACRSTQPGGGQYQPERLAFRSRHARDTGRFCSKISQPAAYR